MRRLVAPSLVLLPLASTGKRHLLALRTLPQLTNLVGVLLKPVTFYFTLSALSRLIIIQMTAAHAENTEATAVTMTAVEADATTMEAVPVDTVTAMTTAEATVVDTLVATVMIMVEPHDTATTATADAMADAMEDVAATIAVNMAVVAATVVVAAATTVLPEDLLLTPLATTLQLPQLPVVAATTMTGMLVVKHEANKQTEWRVWLGLAVDEGSWWSRNGGRRQMTTFCQLCDPSYSFSLFGLYQALFWRKVTTAPSNSAFACQPLGLSTTFHLCDRSQIVPVEQQTEHTIKSDSLIHCCEYSTCLQFNIADVKCDSITMNTTTRMRLSVPITVPAQRETRYVQYALPTTDSMGTQYVAFTRISKTISPASASTTRAITRPFQQGHSRFKVHQCRHETPSSGEYELLHTTDLLHKTFKHAISLQNGTLYCTAGIFVAEYSLPADVTSSTRTCFRRAHCAIVRDVEFRLISKLVHRW